VQIQGGETLQFSVIHHYMINPYTVYANCQMTYPEETFSFPVEKYGAFRALKCHAVAKKLT
jgi:hypothetical protein